MSKEQPRQSWMSVLGLPALGLLAAFAPAWIALSEVWDSRDYYSHGYLVPLVSLWAAAGIAAGRRRLRFSTDARGLGLLAVAALGYAAGLGTGWAPLLGLSLVIAVAALVWARCGTRWLRALAFPVGFLLFMVPLPDVWVSPVIVSLQLFVSHVAVGLVRFAGMAVHRDGNVIELAGGESLFVAEACSGITSVITLIPIAVVVAYFTDRSTRRRVGLLLAVVPLALLGNLIRVVGTIVAAQEYGAAAATQGSLHELAGVMTYVVGCLALLGVGSALRRWLHDAAVDGPRLATETQ
jgi:exosortase